MGKYLDKSIKDYLDELSVKQMTPGGGSAAAFSAALGAALNLMVINYSMKEPEHDETVKGLKEKQERSLERLEKYIDEDCLAFKRLMEKLSREKDAEEEYKNAASVPFSVCEECLNSLRITEDLVPLANPNLKSDIGCAVYTIKGAFFSAKLNVEINLRFIKDKSFCADRQNKIREMEDKIVPVGERILSGI